jgi:lincosamide and streptogramin A transport system ATP-binding/permease protein
MDGGKYEEVADMSLISIKDLTFGYEGSYDNIFENVDLTLDTRWRLGLIGRNGRGKTTLLRLLQGKHEYGGSISAAVDFDYFPFEAEDKSLDTWEIAHNVSGGAEQWRILKELSALDADESILYQPFYTLSGGEQTKVMLAALFLKENNFLLIDEPTNHLDISAREKLSQYMDTKKGFIHGVPRQGFCGRLRRPRALHKSRGYRSAEGKFFHVAAKPPDGGRL